MAKYNNYRTAYQRYWSEESWYLVPSGKRFAPMVWMGEGPHLRINQHDRVTNEHINLLTKKDRAILLESINAGCFDAMWNEMKDALVRRGKNNLKKLKEFVDE